MNRRTLMPRGTRAWIAAACAVAAAVAVAPDVLADWTFWRGPHANGTSDETGLPESWSPEGENLAWRADFIGRSTPVVIDGRVCAIGRVGEKETPYQQERVACFDAETGAEVWNHEYPIYHTTVAFNRAGWASPAADAETGYVYTHGAAGQLHAYTPDGSLAWSNFLPETVGRASGYGGRTQTPIVEGDLLILSFVSVGWGDQAAPRHRTFAFDKRTGDIVWVATPGEMVKDMNTQGGPVVADIGDRRLIVSGNADGWIYAIDLATQETVWKFHLSKRGINVHPVVDDEGRVFLSHSEENLDAPNMGRILALDGTRTGEITGTGELWRIDEHQAGFPSPMLHGNDLYVIDNSANLLRIDAGTGAVRATHSVGTVGKASPVWADGKIYATEVNGRIHILKPGDDGIATLDHDEVQVPAGDRYAEIYGSPAIAYGRVFIATEGGLFAIGKDYRGPAASKKAKRAKAKKKIGAGEAVAIRVVPGDVILAPGEKVSLEVRAFDDRGRQVAAPAVTWSVEGVPGEAKGGAFTVASDAGAAAGRIVAKAGALSAASRVRVLTPFPLSDDFASLADGESPATWIAAKGKFVGGELEGERVLVQPPKKRGVQRSATYLGKPDDDGYTIQVDFRGTAHKRRRPDIGVINAGYTLDLKGVKQELEIRSWASELRMATQVPFEWDIETWHTMKFRVDRVGDKVVIRGKVWKTGEAEPDGWTIETEDTYPILSGSPGLIAYAPVNVYYDNLKVTVD